MLAAVPAGAADLKPANSETFDRYVRVTEQQVEAERRRPVFLCIDGWSFRIHRGRGFSLARPVSSEHL